MSQPPRKSSSGSKSGSGSGTNRPANRQGAQGGSGKASRPVSPQQGGARPPVTRQPVGRGGRYAQPERTGFMASVDRVLPPFSAQRYVAIWVLGMIPLILIILLLTQLGKGSPTTTTQPIPTTQAGSAAGGATAAPQPATGSQDTAAPAPKMSLSGPGKYMVIDTAKGKIVCKLFTDPEAGVSKTIANFETKAKAGYFNGLTFHRVEDWVIQGGDPLGRDPNAVANNLLGTGGGTMPSEYNHLTFGPGALGIARGGDPTINNDSQFFITKSDASYLDGQYTNWGQVVGGMDVVNQIAIGDKINTLTIEDLQQAP